MSHMYILRGGPGAGKSFYVEQLKTFSDTPLIICSADDFFVNDKGVYDFDPAWLGRAHGACFRRAVDAVTKRQDLVIDNTNSSPEEMLPYLALCQAFSYSCEVIKVLCDREVAWERQQHAVPREKFDAIYTTIEQTRVPKLYRGAHWLTERDVGALSRRPVRGIYKPYSGARCAQCRGTIVYSYSDGSKRGFRYCDHEMDTCECYDGKELPSEPFAGLDRKCNCGVSLGIRSDHEAECAAAYLRRTR